jgi:hypothetical protein
MEEQKALVPNEEGVVPLDVQIDAPLPPEGIFVEFTDFDEPQVSEVDGNVVEFFTVAQLVMYEAGQRKVLHTAGFPHKLSPDEKKAIAENFSKTAWKATKENRPKGKPAVADPKKVEAERVRKRKAAKAARRKNRS